MNDDELVDLLRNKTSLARFSKGEVRDLIALMRELGLMSEPESADVA